MIFSSDTFPLLDFHQFKKQCLVWANTHNLVLCLDNNAYPKATFELLVAVDCVASYTVQDRTAWQDLNAYIEHKKSWIFGHIAYDLVSILYPTKNAEYAPNNFPPLFFFEPRILLKIQQTSVSIEVYNGNPKTIFDAIMAQPTNLIFPTHPKMPIKWKSNFEEKTYLQAIEKIQTEIFKGNCYELNFCIQYFTENIELNPLMLYFVLNQISPTPFSCYYKKNRHYLLCASPERFLKKTNQTLITQPIKGTIKRDLEDKWNDQKLKEKLQTNPKERAENIMIVDLVRNDLSRVCQPGTVKVSELCSVEAFPQVFQMKSTVEGKLEMGKNFADIIAACFPMGSMTGAPKIKVMELINKFEKTPRGIYSGAVGYINPDNNFDFNVVIRSLIYDQQRSRLSYNVGSAITAQSLPAVEYQECQLKAKGLLNSVEEYIRLAQNND